VWRLCLTGACWQNPSSLSSDGADDQDGRRDSEEPLTEDPAQVFPGSVLERGAGPFLCAAEADAFGVLVVEGFDGVGVRSRFNPSVTMALTA
jgi:hypothetical protein